MVLGANHMSSSLLTGHITSLSLKQLHKEPINSTSTFLRSLDVVKLLAYDIKLSKMERRDSNQS